MGQQASRREDGSARKKRRGVIGAIFHFLTLLVGVSFASWFFLWIYFVLGELVQNEEKVDKQINSIVQMNIALLREEDHFLVGNAYTAFESIAKNLLYGALIKTHLSEGWQYLSKNM